MCISWSDEGVASAVKVRDVPRSSWVFQPYFVRDKLVVSWITDTGSKGDPLFRFGMGCEGG